ncbi:MAG: hypothetical protein WCR04_01360 [Fibrobacteraceae bacterium]
MRKPFDIKAFLKKKLSSLIFFGLSAIVLVLASTILFGESYKEIFIALMLWSLPLFLH